MIKARYQKMYTEKYKQDMDFVLIGDYYLGPFVDMDVAQKAVSAINKQLSPQPNLSRTEYEKVTESIFDLKGEFERGELYFNFGDGEWFTYKDEASLAIGFKEDNVHRKIEVEIDWRDEVSDHFVEYEISDGSGEYRIDSDDFLAVCRKVLRATGELE